MIGNNTIEMNQATMNAAIEHYLTTVVLKEPVKVVNVRPGKGSYSDTFTVEIAAIEKEAGNGSL